MKGTQTQSNVHYSSGAYVELVRTLPNGGRHVEARCVLQNDGTVNCVGDEKLVARLSRGITLTFPEPQLFTTKDGVVFLRALQTHFSTPYLFATEIQPASNVSSAVI